MFFCLQLLFMLSSALCEQMDWGDNQYLVDESVTIQGREHIKLAVVMVGGKIYLECQVAFTSDPVSKIRWKIDGKLTDDAENQTEEIKNGEIFVEAHLKIVNITADMDGSTVSCEYSKGQYGASVETVFRVFSAEIDIPEEVFNTKVGDAKLTFKESKRTSPAEDTVDEKIRAMIETLTNVSADEITVDEYGYYVNLNIVALYNNPEILDMQPKTKIDGAYVEDDNEYNEISLKSDEIERGNVGWLVSFIVITLLGTFILVTSLFARRMVKHRKNLASRLKDEKVEDAGLLDPVYF